MHVLSSKCQCWRTLKPHSLSRGSRQGVTTPQSASRLTAGTPGRVEAAPRASQFLQGQESCRSRPTTSYLTGWSLSCQNPNSLCLPSPCSRGETGEQTFACRGPAGIAKACGTKKNTTAILISLQLAKTPSAFSLCMYRWSLHIHIPL